MTTLKCAIFKNASRAAFLLSILLTALPLARADDLTGQPVDDPKDLLPTPSTPSQPSGQSGGLFAPMPAWARGITLGPMPAKLLPMGRDPKAVAAKPQPLAPPKDSDSTSTTSSPVSTPGPKPTSDPAFIAVSPFLQWIKANPQAAAAQARQQADAYHAAAPVPENAAPGAAPATAAPHNPQDDAYWLPPLIDTADFGPTAPPVVTGSSATYTRPAR